MFDFTGRGCSKLSALFRRAGAEGLSLAIEHVGFGNGGSYRVVVANAAGTVESAEAQVEVLPSGVLAL